MEAFITGIGWVTSGGIGMGKGGSDFLPGSGELPRLSRKDVFDEPNQRFGRQSEYSKLGLAAVALALRDAGLEKWSEKRPVSVFAATVLGCLATDSEYFQTVLLEGGALASPNLFAFTLANCFLGEAALQFGLTGSLMAVNEGEGGGVTPLRLALEEMAIGDAGTALAGICDLPVPEGMEKSLPLQPGAAFILLSAEEPQEEGYGKVSLGMDGTVSFDGAPVSSFFDLVRGALALRRGPERKETVTP
ncbi:hypothetical protein LPW11_15885 [Geomonas sp. RF6]|uniref:beta-ketoacyl synthase N-terminal-like domain-containing protein n=1 Tax=Geomonas sp. RF6 TaxID=2897342 RepID=UPI001E531214|nr:beta-ketoacyl synthase N-terminal-like domain-containing protein [Geomonas sp. RF6]UFS69369.1 hypothetical protein LPW11_15885 [Geomonas sp. RF6]